MPLDSELEPFVWRVQWPADIAAKLQVYDQISISDAESGGVILQQMVLEAAKRSLRHRMAVSFCDNTPAVTWVTRMASQRSRVGGRLVKGLAIRARARRMGLPRAFHIAGERNEMADVSSRSFSAASGYDMTDVQRLAHFDNRFPLPQSRSWRIVTLPSEDTSKVFSTLRGERLTMAQWTSRGDGGPGTTC